MDLPCQVGEPGASRPQGRRDGLGGAEHSRGTQEVRGPLEDAHGKWQGAEGACRAAALYERARAQSWGAKDGKRPGGQGHTGWNGPKTDKAGTEKGESPVAAGWKLADTADNRGRRE